MLALPQGADAMARLFLCGPPMSTMECPGSESFQMFPDADRTDTRATTAMRNAKGLVQVQMRNISAKFARCCAAHQGIQIGAIQVDLATMFMDHIAYFPDIFFENTMGGWIGDHQGTQVVRVFCGLFLEVAQINITVFVTPDHDYLHPGHCSAGRIGAVG